MEFTLERTWPFVAYNQDEALRSDIDLAEESSPSDAGSLLISRALQSVIGGEVRVLVRNDDVAGSAVLVKDNLVWGLDKGEPDTEANALRSQNRFLDKTTYATYGPYTALRPFKEGDLPDALRDEKLEVRIASRIARKLDDFGCSNQINDRARGKSSQGLPQQHDMDRLSTHSLISQKMDQLVKMRDDLLGVSYSYADGSRRISEFATHQYDAAAQIIDTAIDQLYELMERTPDIDHDKERRLENAYKVTMTRNITESATFHVQADSPSDAEESAIAELNRGNATWAIDVDSCGQEPAYIASIVSPASHASEHVMDNMQKSLLVVPRKP